MAGAKFDNEVFDTSARGKTTQWKELLMQKARSGGERLGNASLSKWTTVFSDVLLDLAKGIETGIVLETQARSIENQNALSTRADGIEKRMDVRADSMERTINTKLDNAERGLQSKFTSKAKELKDQAATDYGVLRQESTKARESAGAASTSASAANLNAGKAELHAKDAAESVSAFTKDLSSLEEIDDESKQVVKGPGALSVLASRFRRLQERLSAIDTIFEALTPLMKAFNDGIEVQMPDGSSKAMNFIDALNHAVTASLQSAKSAERAATDARSAESVARQMLEQSAEDINKAHASLKDAADAMQRISAAPSAPELGSAATKVTALSSGFPSSRPRAPAGAASAAPDLATELEAITITKSRRTLAPPFSAPPAPNPEPVRLPRPSPVPVVCPVNEGAPRGNKDFPSLAPVSEPPKAAEPVALEEEPTKQSAETSLPIAESLSKRFSATEAMVSEILSRMKPKIDSAYDEAAEGLETDLKDPSFKLQGAIDGTQLEARAVSAFETLDSHLRTLSILLDNDELQEEMKRASYDLTGTTLEVRLENSFSNYTKKARRLWDSSSFRSEPPSMTKLATLMDEAEGNKRGDS